MRDPMTQPAPDELIFDFPLPPLPFSAEQSVLRLRIKALRAQRLELYSMRRHHEIGDDVLSEILKDLDMSEANLGQVK